MGIAWSVDSSNEDATGTLCFGFPAAGERELSRQFDNKVVLLLSNAPRFICAMHCTPTKYHERNLNEHLACTMSCGGQLINKLVFCTS